MKRCESELCLLDSDLLENTTNTFNRDSEDARSSGYESCDSFTQAPSPPSTPSSKVRASSSGHKEVMMYSNMADLSESLQYITSMPELCDVTFLVGNRHLPIHGVKAILATRSRVFYQMILHHQRKVTESVKPKSRLRMRAKSSTVNMHSKLQIPIPDYDHVVFSSLLNFLHSGRVRVQLGTVIGLFCAAIEFGLKDLQKACWDFLKRCVGEDQKRALMTSTQHYLKKKGAQKILSQVCRL
ncbi:serine-enriched protein-like [Haliotis cracherodii]|uniref:serine-enriched protein-like n=1 Tax=Haliotis cracherodii TaxID=6455 RepID=UPI0039EC7C38